MTQPQANQYLLDTGYTQNQIDYAFECCAPMATILSQLDDVQETEPVQESETHKIFERTESVQRMDDGIVARPLVVIERN